MKREELFMDILGDLDEKYIAFAMPDKSSRDNDTAADTKIVTSAAHIDDNDKTAKKDHIIYIVTRVLGVAAALALIAGGGAWLWKNWDKIAVREPDRPGVVTTVTAESEPAVTIPSESDRLLIITDKSMPEPFAANEDPAVYGGTDGRHDDFCDLWKKDFYAIDERLQELAGFERASEIIAGYKAEEAADIEAGNITRYKLDDTHNRYRFIMDARLSAEDVERALRGTDNTRGGMVDPDIFVSFPSKEETVRNNMTEYCIAVGKYVFSPRWLYYHTTDDYKAAGITPAAINAMLEKYRELGLTDEAWNAFRDKLLRYTSSEADNYGGPKTYPVRDDQIHPVFDERSIEIFDEYFCGVWECENETVYLKELPLTYTEDVFDYGHAFYPCVIVETDELYGLHYINGGEGSAYTVFKNEPGVIYDCAYNYYNGGIENCGNAVYLYPECPKYTDRVQTETPRLRAGKLSNLGQRRLLYEMGDDFAGFWHETLLNDEGYNGNSFDGDGYTDENGTSWLIVSSMAYPRDTRYLVSYDSYSDEPSVTVAIPYYEKSEYETHDYLDENEEVSWKKYFALEFTKKEGEWQVTHRPYEPETIIEVAKPEKKIELSVNIVLDADAVTADYTYKLIEDYENNETWQRVKEWAEASYTGETLDLYRRTDYFCYPEYSVFYVGNEACDYVVRKMFGFANYQQYNTWEIFIFVKDGKAVGATDIIERSGLGCYVDGNDLYENGTENNILHIDLLTFEYDLIPVNNGYSYIADINDDWFICGNGTLYAYDRHTGEIINTGIDWNGMYSDLMRLNGNRIEYTDERGKGYWYDLETGESGEDPGLWDTPVHFVFENSRYKAHSYYNTTAEPSSKEFDFSKITITRRSDGMTKVFDFEKLLGGKSGETDGTVLNHLFMGDWFITKLNGYGRIAVNFETGDCADVNDIFKNSSIWYDTICGDRNFVMCLDENGNGSLLGELEYTVRDD